MDSFRTPVTLTGRWVALVPLSPAQAPALLAAAWDPEVSRYILRGPGKTLEDVQSLITLRLSEREAGTGLPFATVLRSDNRPVGMTGYLHIDRENRSVEVGGTWLDSALWRTPLNTETKYLLFRHAFEVEMVHRITLQTDVRNERSQRAIERLGAVREALMRDDKLRADGSYRSSVFYGLLVSEWPVVKARLEKLLAQEWEMPLSSGPSSEIGSDPGRKGG